MMIGGAALGLVAYARTAGAQAFSADVAVTNDSGRDHPTGPMHMTVSGQKMRIETGHGTVIVDGQAGSTVMLQPDKKLAITVGAAGTPAFSQYMASFDPENACPQWQAMSKNRPAGEGGWTCQKLGDDTVGGRSVVKYESTNGKGEHSTAWIDSRLRFPVKVESPHVVMTLTNIQEGAQPANLFEVPPGYQSMDMSAMMQGMGKFKGGPPGATPHQ